jgi:hypothetical protein
MANPTPEFSAFRAKFASLTEEEMVDLVDRRHPEYLGRLAHWNFCEATYVGGREWFRDGNIFQGVKEGPTEYQERIDRAYRFPHTREVVDLVNKYIFKAKIKRDAEKASKEVQKFWRASMVNRRNIDDFMRLVSERASYLGRPWIVVDTNQTEPDATLLQEKESGARLYAYVVKPQHVLDLGVSEDGDLNWIKIAETKREDEDVLSSGEIKNRFRVWTKMYWALFEQVSKEDPKTKQTKVVYELLEAGEHGLGRVPVFPVDHIISDNPYWAMSLVDDIAYLDRAVANYLSNLDAIIQDQTFSQLIMPAQSLLPGDDEMKRLIELGTKRIFTYDATGEGKPEYISPDPKQAPVILAVINKIINEIYHSVGMAGERTKQDNAMGIDNSSGVAKAFDFERLNAVLTSKANALEIAENTLCELVDCWYGQTPEPGSYDLVKYPESFDTRGLADELNIAAQLNLIQAPDKLRQEQMKTLVEKLLPHLSADVVAAIRKEIETSWPPEPPEAATSGSPPSAFSGEKRQGQNTGKSDKK